MPPLREADVDPLMDRLASGDRAAFDPLYAALRPRALWLARRRVGDAEAADVAQSALLKVFARASEFTPGRPCLPWFYALVANEIQASRRKRARLVSGSEYELAPIASEVANADEQLLRRELELSVEAAILALDHDSASTIAAVLGREPLPALAAPTFRKRVSRAYAKLRRLLGTDHAD